VGERCGRMPVRFVENPLYGETGTSYSFWLGLQALGGGGALLFEGDVFFERKLLDRFLASGEGTATVGQRYHPALQGTLMTAGPDGFLNEWAHEDGRRPGFPVHESYKSVNISRLTPEFIDRYLSPALEECLRTRGLKVPLEKVMDRIVRDAGGAVSLFDAAGCRWVEIDDPEDLRRAEEIFQAVLPSEPD
jgi:choline kinase